MIRYNRKQDPHINKKPVSIIVTAWQTSQFIEDCLDSIESQTYFASNDNFEVLVGIDGCAQTLKKVEEIAYKYRNLKVFMMESHVGTYVTSNTLLNLASKDHIIRFDSDDIMLPEMVEEVMAQTDNYDFIQYGFKTFTGSKSQTFERKFWAACGSVYYNRSFIDAAGGYRPWLCSADLELIRRTENSPFRRGIIEKRLFLLRSHPNSLASKADTKLGGGYRLSLERGIRVFKPHENIKIERKITGFRPIENNSSAGYLKVGEAKSGVFNKELPTEVKNEVRYSSQTKNTQGISMIITAWKTANYIEQCLDSIESQSYFINNNNYEILLGIDGCQETLAKVKEILEKYRNLRVFMMEENVGTYVTTNTLLDLVSYDNIIRFDSDDYMMPHMISEVMAASEEYDFIRFHFDDFDDVRKEMRPRAFLAMGAVYYKKWVIEKAGGYKDWRCNADLELLKRISNSDIRFGEIKKPLFVRRIHPNSLSEREETGIRSFFRKNLTNRVRIYDKGEDIRIEKVAGKYREIYGGKNIRINREVNKYQEIYGGDTKKTELGEYENKIDKVVNEYEEICMPYIYDISFIIPIRGREDQIEGLEYNIKQFFGDYNYEIIYVNQNDNKLFKRGQLCNIGFKESKGNIVIFQDVDIRHFQKIDIKDLLKKYNSPFVAFDEITQIYENKLGEYKKIKTEKRIYGWGACAIFNRNQFIQSGGFSNLIFGWGAEDNILNERAHFKRYIHELGHVFHKPLRTDIELHKTQYYKNNQNVFLNHKNIDPNFDGFNQTSYQFNKIQKADNILILNVEDIGVIDNFKYMNLYNIYSKEDLQNPTDIKTIKIENIIEKKLKILLVPDKPGWAFDNIANAIIKYNPYDNIEYTIRHVRTNPDSYDRSEFVTKLFNYDDWDYVYVFFEDERSIPHNPKKLIKGCYSALWLETNRITQESLSNNFNSCRGIVFANHKIQSLVTPYCPTIDNTIINDGSDPDIFYPLNEPKFEEFTVLFAGNTEREIKRFDVIKRICEAANVNLKVARNVPRNEINSLYNKVHLCINFSISEGGPQTLFEAALCSTPMLINSAIAMTEKIPCFTASTENEMIEKLKYLKKNPKECIKKGQEARKIVLENYTFNHVSKKFGDFFLKMAMQDNLLHADITAFVISFGENPNYNDCIEALKNQTIPCKIDVIKDYAPSSRAFQEMLNRCTTKYYVQVDEDMILHPDAIEKLYLAISNPANSNVMISYGLHDVHLDFDIIGIKIYNYEVYKNYPYNLDPKSNDIPSIEQTTRVKGDGYDTCVDINTIVGYHSPKWTEELIFERYFDLMDKYKIYGYTWLKDLPNKLEKIYINDPSELNYYAMMGAKISAKTKLVRNRQKDYRIIDENFLKIKKERNSLKK